MSDILNNSQQDNTQGVVGSNQKQNGQGVTQSTDKKDIPFPKGRYVNLVDGNDINFNQPHVRLIDMFYDEHVQSFMSEYTKQKVKRIQETGRNEKGELVSAAEFNYFMHEAVMESTHNETVDYNSRLLERYGKFKEANDYVLRNATATILEKASSMNAQQRRDLRWEDCFDDIHMYNQIIKVFNCDGEKANSHFQAILNGYGKHTNQYMNAIMHDDGSLTDEQYDELYKKAYDANDLSINALNQLEKNKKERYGNGMVGGRQLFSNDKTGEQRLNGIAKDMINNNLRIKRLVDQIDDNTDISDDNIMLMVKSAIKGGSFNEQALLDPSAIIYDPNLINRTEKVLREMISFSDSLGDIREELGGEFNEEEINAMAMRFYLMTGRYPTANQIRQALVNSVR